MNWLFLLIMLCIIPAASGQYYGMQFSAHEFSLDQRSGLDLTPGGDIDFKDNLVLEFYLRFDPDHESYFGYIFRLVLGDRNIDLIHGIVRGNPNNFELILGDRTSRIAFPVAIERLLNEWLHLRFELDFKNQKITCFVQDRKITDDLVGFDNTKGFRLMFGAHSYGNYSSTDVPAMIIRDVKVKVKENLSYLWPLDETQGTVSHSVPAGKNGVATNPDWLLKHHNTWNKMLDMELNGTVKTTFDPRSETVYLVSSDTVYKYDVVRDSLTRITQKSPSFIESPSEIIFDTLSHRLLLYSLDNIYLGVFNAETGEWSHIAPGIEPLTAYWHHNRLITSDGSLLVLGGYGYHMYKNSVLAWNPEKSRYDSIPYKGDFYPRYLAGSGFNPNDSLFYVIGGFGSESGKQSESPDYYYEILSFSPEDSSFSSVLEFQDTEAGFCFANSVVFDDKDNLYGLYFPKYEFNNRLQLVRIPLEDPGIIEVGNPIEYSFIDINSFADLYYSKSLDALIALSSYSADGSTSLSIHSIAFPPQVFTTITAAKGKNRSRMAIYFLAITVLLILTSLLFFYRRRKTAPGEKPIDISGEPVQKQKENSIFLFGGFQVLDKQGKDITGRFTPLPKKLFLYILLHSLRNAKGVSSNALYETFWFDKSVENARNNRAVNIVKLKSLLENLESTSVSKDTGYWKFDFDSSKLHIDYFEYLRIIRRESELTREDIVALLSMVENKPFLSNTQADWLDSFKSDISNEIIDTFLKYISNSKDDPEFLLHLTNCIFIVDAVSEEALRVKCRLLLKQGKHSLAKSAYAKFTKDYQQLYDEEYGLSFSQVIGE